MSTPLQEALSRLSIVEVYQSAGGGELRNGRGRAFWRDGEDFNVSIDKDKGVWHDFVSGDGGNIVGLVCTALDKTPGEAARWLIALAAVEDRPLTEAERRQYHAVDLDAEEALLFRVAVNALAEHCLKVDSVFDPNRAHITALAADVRRDLLAVFRDYQQDYPELTRGLVNAGRNELERREIAAMKELVNAA